MAGKALHELCRGIGGAVERIALPLFRRLLRLHILSDEGDEPGVPLLRPLEAALEPQALAAALIAVLDVVGELIVKEHGVERTQLVRQFVRDGDGLLFDGVFETVLLFDLHVDARDVVKEHRKEGHVVGEPDARHLPARMGDPLAQAAVHRPVKFEVLDIQVGQIVADVSEHVILPDRSRLCGRLCSRYGGRS